MRQSKHWMQTLLLGAYLGITPAHAQNQAATTLSPAPKLEPARDEAHWIAQRVLDWQPTARELSWQRIGWAENISEALRLAGQHKRPIFLFTLDGHMGAGRC